MIQLTPQSEYAGRRLGLVVLLLGCLARPAWAGDHTLDLTYPPPSTNAALHYQRGLLFLSVVDSGQRELLRQPIWELVAATSDEGQLDSINGLLYESRHAIRSALIGARQGNADFGIDPSQYAVASYVPHADAMIELGKLVLLHAMQLEANGEWKEAGETYARAFTMARHLTRQNTLVEVLTGVKMLESTYYAISKWAVDCPEQSLVDDAALLLDVYSHEAVDPARTMLREFQILALQLETFRAAYPDGPWAEMLLEALDAPIPSGSDRELQDAAKAAATERGLPADLFKDQDAFQRHLQDREQLYLTMARETAVALTKRGQAGVAAGKTVYDKHAASLKRIGDPEALNPGQIAAIFATHDAEQTLAKIVLTLAANKGANGFPGSLDELKEEFGGQVPRSPYDGSAVIYRQLGGGRGFDVSVAKVDVAGIELPQIGFKYEPAK